MQPSESDISNMRETGLTLEQLREQERLFSLPRNQWPDTLQEYVKSAQSQIGLCGDVLLGLMADWLKGKRAPFRI